MISKIIHYCWFGGNPLPELAQKCIASWKKYCPDFEIMEWNESNFDIHCNAYVEEAYAAGKWAFVSDVARLCALKAYGGIYMDTDVEVISSLDTLLAYDLVLGFETEDKISTGIMASCKDNALISEMLRDYEHSHFIRQDGSFDVTTNVKRITAICLKYGFQMNNTRQHVQDMLLLPKEYFSPKDFETAALSVTEHTLVIHHFDGSWHSAEDRCFFALKKKFKRFLPGRSGSYLARYISILKYHGFLKGNQALLSWLRKK